MIRFGFDFPAGDGVGAVCGVAGSVYRQDAADLHRDIRGRVDDIGIDYSESEHSGVGVAARGRVRHCYHSRAGAGAGSHGHGTAGLR